MKDEKNNGKPLAVSQSMTSIPSMRRVLAEIAFVFAVFFIQGAWPVPDVNEPYYLGKTIHYWNPAWAAGDFFLDSKDIHKVFYLTFGWLSLWLTPTALAWTGRLVTWWLLAWSWRRLSFAILPRPGLSILSAALFAMLMDRFHMAGEWVIGGAEAKCFAYVLVFLGLEALILNRWNRMWLFFGAASAFHVLVGGWAVVAVALAWLFIGPDRPRLSTMLPALLGGFLLALPGLIPAATLNAHTDPDVIQHANQIYVFERLGHHLDLFRMDTIFIIRFLLLTELYFILSWSISLARSSSPADSRSFLKTVGPTKPSFRSAIYNLQSNANAYNIANPSYKRFRAFVMGAIAISLVGAAINMLAFINTELAADLLRFYWFRQTDVVIPLSAAIFGPLWLVDSWSSRPRISRFAAILVGISLIYHFGDLTIKRLQPTTPRAERLANPLDWREACLWAADERNTPCTARFITPRMAQTFKWYAHRAEVATWKDVPQDAIEIVEWRGRIEDLFTNNGGNPEYRWYESLNELSPERLEQLAKKYKADYLITESIDPPLNLKIVYQNENYIIYWLKGIRD
jgi:hypothetical protein